MTRPATNHARWSHQALATIEGLVWSVFACLAVFVPALGFLLNELFILALFALAVELVLGFGGILVLGEAAFFGLGAYGAVALAKCGCGDPLLGLCIGGGVAAVAGAITGALIVRGSDLSRLAASFILADAMRDIFNQLGAYTGGSDGLAGLVFLPLFGVLPFAHSARTASLYSLLVLFVLFVFARIAIHAPFGLALKAIKDNPVRAQSLGLFPHHHGTAIYAMGAFYAGVAGALFAQTNAFVALDVFDATRSADVLLMVIVGSPGWLYGALLGASFWRGAQTALSFFSPAMSMFWIGLALTSVMAARLLFAAKR